MLSFVTNTIFRLEHSTNIAIHVSKFHTCFTVYLDQRRRQKKGLIANPNKHGPLVTLSDYSFKDNRPTAYGSRQLYRIKKHQDYVKRILQLVEEVDHAVERHAKLMTEKEESNLIENVLKPKGQKLITSD